MTADFDVEEFLRQAQADRDRPYFIGVHGLAIVSEHELEEDHSAHYKRRR